MARYFFQLRGGTTEDPDLEGSELADLAAVERAAVLGARELMADGVMRGLLDLHYRFDVEDGEGVVLYSLAFADALLINGYETAVAGPPAASG